MNNLFLIVSEDNEVIEFNLNNILNKLKDISYDKIEYDNEENSLEDVLDEASTISMFSMNKVIIFNNFRDDLVSDSEYTYLEKYLENKNKDVYLIFISNKFDSRKKVSKLIKDNFNVIIVDKVTENDLTSYIKNKIKEKGYKIDEYLLEYLLSRTGTDINNINNELDKLFIYCDNVITKEAIDTLIMDSVDNVMYEFTNAILDNDIDKSVMMYDNFKKDNMSFDYIIASISGSMHTNIVIKLLYSQGKSNLDIAKVIGKKEFFVKKSLERLYKYSISDLAGYIEKLAIIDREFKSGKSNIDKLRLFIIDKDNNLNI